MYTQFIYKSGSNPYIATTNKNLFKMICKYYLTQVDCHTFNVDGERMCRKAKTYKDKRDFLEFFAIEWQYKFSDMCYSWDDISNWSAFFEEYGKKYGLLREFRENGII